MIPDANREDLALRFLRIPSRFARGAARGKDHLAGEFMRRYVGTLFFLHLSPLDWGSRASHQIQERHLCVYVRAGGCVVFVQAIGFDSYAEMRSSGLSPQTQTLYPFCFHQCLLAAHLWAR